MMGPPAWLYYLFGGLMFAVALYSVALLLVSFISRFTTGRDVDLSHLAMGVAMAGMFVPAWSFGSRAGWDVIFAGFLVWFVVRTIQSVQAFGLHLPHYAIHAVMNFAMLMMFWFPPSASSSGGMGMGMGGSGGHILQPGLGFVLAVFLLAAAVFTLASPNKGASHSGRHASAWAVATERTSEAFAEGAAIGVENVLATPWLEDLSHVVMLVGMAFMLILML